MICMVMLKFIEVELSGWTATCILSRKTKSRFCYIASFFTARCSAECRVYYGKSSVRLSVKLVYPDDMVLNFLKIIMNNRLGYRYWERKQQQSAPRRSFWNSTWNRGCGREKLDFGAKKMAISLKRTRKKTVFLFYVSSVVLLLVCCSWAKVSV